jgi:uncharacterized protein YjaG (DUF416 family)
MITFEEAKRATITKFEIIRELLDGDQFNIAINVMNTKCKFCTRAGQKRSTCGRCEVAHLCEEQGLYWRLMRAIREDDLRVMLLIDEMLEELEKVEELGKEG